MKHTRQQSSNLFNSAAVGAGVILFIHFLWIGLIPPTPLRGSVSVLLVAVDSWLAAGMLFSAARQMRINRRILGEAWGIIAAAYLLWALGHTIWAVRYGILKQSSFPSLADAFYLAFYLLFLIGILRLPTTHMRQREQLRLLLDLGIVVISAALVVWTFLINPSVAEMGRQPTSVMLLSLAYPVGDLVLLWSMSVLIYRRINTTRRLPLYLLSASILAIVLTDLFFGMPILRNGSTAGTIVDLGWGFAGLAAALAGLALIRELSRTDAIEDLTIETGGGEPGESLSLYFPYLWLVVAYLLLSWNLHGVLPRNYTPLSLGIGLIIVLVVSKQLYSLWENSRMYEQLQKVSGELEARVHKRTEELAQANLDLARSNAFLAALSELAARVESTNSLAEVEAIMNAELSRLGLSYALLLSEGDAGKLVVQSVSVTGEAARTFEEIADAPLIGYQLPERARPRSGADPKQWYIDPLSFLKEVFPESSRGALQQLARAFGVDTNTRLVCLPLKVAERAIGSLAVWGAGLQSEDLQALSVFGYQVAAVIEKARLIASVQRRAMEAETLRHATAVVSSALDLDQVLESILIQLERVIPYDSAALFLVESNRMRIRAARGFPEQEQIVGRIFPKDDALLRVAATTRRPLILPDAQKDPRFARWAGTSYVHGWMGVPMIARDEVVGFLTVDSRRAGAYNEQSAVMAEVFANEAAIAIVNARLFEEVQQLAITDPLTGLYNHRHFFRRSVVEFERARRFDHSLAVIMLDIDSFKQVNDTYGHQVGDQVLREVAARLSACVRDIDIVARYGGEEFVILLTETGLQGALQAAERIRNCLSGSPIEAQGHKVTVQASMGVAEKGRDDSDIEVVVGHADQALYRAKRSGKNRVRPWLGRGSDRDNY